MAALHTYTSHLPDLGLAVCVWEGAGQLPNGDEDRWVVSRRSNQGLRVAAIDGITPTARTATPAGGSGAAFAADLVRAVLCAHGLDLPDAVARAHMLLHDPSVTRSRDRWMAACAAADVSVGGGALVGHVLGAGDCEAWAHSSAGWIQLVAPRFLTPAGQAAFDAGLASCRALPGPFDWQNWFLCEDEAVGRPDLWQGAPLGRFADLPSIATASLPPGCDRLVVATDGARLDEDRIGRLPAWLAGLRATEAATDGLWHGDVAVVEVALLQGH